MTNAPQTTTGSGGQEDDYTMCWLPHLLVILSLWVGPLVLWLINRGKDARAAFHAKQAFCLSAGVSAAIVLLSLLTVIPFFNIVVAVFIWLLLAGLFAYAVYAVISTYKGKVFEYLFVAERLCAGEYAAAYPEAGVVVTVSSPEQAAPPEAPPVSTEEPPSPDQP